MAKFKLKASLIPKLTERNVISPTTGKIKMRIHYSEKPISGVKCVEFEFLPSDVLEFTNEYAIKVMMANKSSPRLKLGGEWFFPDPSIKWFDEVQDAATMQLPATGTEVLVRGKRALLCGYAVDKGLTLDAPLTPSITNQALLQLASEHNHAKHAAR